MLLWIDSADIHWMMSLSGRWLCCCNYRISQKQYILLTLKITVYPLPVSRTEFASPDPIFYYSQYAYEMLCLTATQTADPAVVLVIRRQRILESR